MPLNTISHQPGSLFPNFPASALPVASNLSQASGLLTSLPAIHTNFNSSSSTSSSGSHHNKSAFASKKASSNSSHFSRRHHRNSRSSVFNIAHLNSSPHSSYSTQPTSSSSSLPTSPFSSTIITASLLPPAQPSASQPYNLGKLSPPLVSSANTSSTTPGPTAASVSLVTPNSATATTNNNSSSNSNKNNNIINTINSQQIQFTLPNNPAPSRNNNMLARHSAVEQSVPSVSGRHSIHHANVIGHIHQQQQQQQQHQEHQYQQHLYQYHHHYSLTATLDIIGSCAEVDDQYATPPLNSISNAKTFQSVSMTNFGGMCAATVPSPSDAGAVSFASNSSLSSAYSPSSESSTSSSVSTALTDSSSATHSSSAVEIMDASDTLSLSSWTSSAQKFSAALAALEMIDDSAHALPRAAPGIVDMEAEFKGQTEAVLKTSKEDLAVKTASLAATGVMSVAMGGFEAASPLGSLRGQSATVSAVGGMTATVSQKSMVSSASRFAVSIGIACKGKNMPLGPPTVIPVSSPRMHATIDLESKKRDRSSSLAKKQAIASDFTSCASSNSALRRSSVNNVRGRHAHQASKLRRSSPTEEKQRERNEDLHPVDEQQQQQQQQQEQVREEIQDDAENKEEQEGEIQEEDEIDEEDPAAGHDSMRMEVVLDDSKENHRETNARAKNDGPSGLVGVMFNESSVIKVDCGEDAFFVSSRPTFHALGIADGVGGWQSLGVNPALFAWSLMTAAETLANSWQYTPDPVVLLEKAYQDVVDSQRVNAGSSTACILTLDNSTGILYSANLGDSGFLLLRSATATSFTPPGSPQDENALSQADNPLQRYDLYSRSRDQQHRFNTPFQLSIIPPEYASPNNIIDSPNLAEIDSVRVRDGDIIILATDGLWDNLFDIDILNMVHTFQNNMSRLAEAIVSEARKAACDAVRDSPFAQAARRHGYEFQGGKLDDITVMCAKIHERQQPLPDRMISVL